MPNIKSQKDRVVQAKKETLRNKAVKSNLKTVIKKADSAVAAGSADANTAVNAAVATIDKACAKGVLHKNTAARKVPGSSGLCGGHDRNDIYRVSRVQCCRLFHHLRLHPYDGPSDPV